MAFKDVRDGIFELNAAIARQRELNYEFPIKVNGKPEFRIYSFEPLIYERYGKFINRAPYMAGTFALKGFLIAINPETDNAYVWVGVGAENRNYGIDVGSQTANIVNRAAILLDRPDLSFVDMRRH